nr:PREDICTED: ran guanine nucleotide release factor [Lepisosteus oculatus]
MQRNGSDSHPLFGGALSAVLPHSICDISELREIPDNQEVFAHQHSDQSLIVELLEYQSHVLDGEAARYHFEDVARSNEAGGPGVSEVRSLEPLAKALLSLPDCSSAWLLAGTQLVSKFNEEAKNTVNIYLGLFRLPQHSTDIMVTFNDPVSISPLSSSTGGASEMATAPWTLEDFRLVLHTLRLLDPAVFG